MRPELPTTPAETYDLLQQAFGVGTYDELANSETPWWQSRNTEIAKLKAIMRRRKIKPEEMGKAVWFAQREGVHVATPIRLLPLIASARRAWDEADRTERSERALAEVGDLVEEMNEAGEVGRAEQLMRASAESLPGLIEEWRSR